MSEARSSDQPSRHTPVTATSSNRRRLREFYKNDELRRASLRYAHHRGGELAMREGFQTIVDGWSLVDDIEDLFYRIERSSKWMDANGPLLEDEAATVRLMIQSQIAMKIRRGDFEPYISAATNAHDVLNFRGDRNS